jgi:hypothetical protein
MPKKFHEIDPSQQITPDHRDKTKSADACKNVSSFEIIMFAVHGPPTLGFDTKQRNSFLIKFGVFFYNKNRILTILFKVKYEKITLTLMNSFIVFGAYNQQVFCMFK